MGKIREEDWKSMARNRLRLFEEELHVAHEAGLTTYSGQKSWSFINSVNYCMSIATTIGTNKNIEHELKFIFFAFLPF